MTAPVPITLEDLLHAVVEACVQELAAARHELVTERGSHAAEREQLEAATRNTVAQRQEIVRLEGDLAAARESLKVLAAQGREDGKTIARLERELARGVPSRSRWVDAPPVRHEEAPTAERSADAATRTPSPRSPAVEAGKDAEATPSGEAAKPSAQPTAVGAFNPRLGAEDLTGKRLGSYVCEGKSDAPRRNGGAVWTFRCEAEACGAIKKYSVQDFRRLTRKHVTCPCQVPGRRPPSKPREVTDHTGLVLGSYTCEGDNGADGAARRWHLRCGECRQRRTMTGNHLSHYLREGTVPRCPFCDPSARQGPPPAPAAPPIAPPPSATKRGPGRPPRADKPRQDGTEPGAERPNDFGLDERLDELDPTNVGDDDVDDLLSRAMAEAESDGFIRRGAGAASPPRRAEESDEDDQEDEDGESREARDPDEDPDDETEELDFQ